MSANFSQYIFIKIVAFICTKKINVAIIIYCLLFMKRNTIGSSHK